METIRSDACGSSRCIEVHDLAASKLAAFRDKDRDFVRTLLAEDMISAALLGLRLDGLDLEGATEEALQRWLRITVEDLAEKE